MTLRHWHRSAPYVLAGALGCGTSLPAPQMIAPPKDTFQEVPHPPPAGLVELVPPAPNRRAVWIDGNWAWRGKGFVWQRGGWLIPPEHARYAPWQVRYMTDGTLLFASCGWFDEHGNPLDPPPILVPAATPPNEVTSEFHSTR